MIRSSLEVFFIFLKLGLTSFGGPVAHLGYFHSEFVLKRRWLDEKAYADLVALCQFLPGPASSQVGIALGASRAGTLGAIAAWLGFTLPSAVILVALAFGVSLSHAEAFTFILHGLKFVAVVVVARALWTMRRQLCPDWQRISIAIISAMGVLVFHSAAGQIAMIIFGGVMGILYLTPKNELPHTPLKAPISSRAGLLVLCIFLLLLVALPFMAANSESLPIKLFDSFYRTGSLVFGGGHVVLPLLKTAVVNSGWVSAETFMSGYGAAQVIPGPLFTFSAYLGAAAYGIVGAILCLVGVFLPSFLLVFGVLPFWEKLRAQRRMRKAMLGINSAVVGLLLAAFYELALDILMNL